MRLTIGRGYLLLALALIVGLSAGCGTPPPCNVQPDQVDQARTENQGAEDAAATAASRVEAMEEEIAALEAKVVSADELARLEARLDELKKGSGR